MYVHNCFFSSKAFPHSHLRSPFIHTSFRCFQQASAEDNKNYWASSMLRKLPKNNTSNCSVRLILRKGFQWVIKTSLIPSTKYRGIVTFYKTMWRFLMLNTSKLEAFNTNVNYIWPIRFLVVLSSWNSWSSDKQVHVGKNALYVRNCIKLQTTASPNPWSKMECLILRSYSRALNYQLFLS